MFKLNGRVIVLTGGGGVLGGVIARGLARAGARVAVVDRMVDNARCVAESCGPESIALEGDVLSRDSMEAVAQNVLAAFGRIDVLINGAGGNHPKATTNDTQSFFDLDEAAFRAVFDLNLMGTILPCQIFGRMMAEQGTGNIITISSMNGFRPLTRIPAYSAAKAGVINFTQWLAVHMAKNYSTGIRVNSIAPGFFLTEQNRFLVTDEKTGDWSPRGKTIVEHTPMGRFGVPEDLVGPFVWLCSEASAFVHGTVIPIDGGFSAFSGV